MSDNIVNANVLALNSYRSLKPGAAPQSKVSARLSPDSGADDAAGLTISGKARAQGAGEIASENASAAQSHILDADAAREMMAISRAKVLQQPETSMLAQANQTPQNVLQLLR